MQLCMTDQNCNINTSVKHLNKISSRLFRRSLIGPWNIIKIDKSELPNS